MTVWNHMLGGIYRDLPVDQKSTGANLITLGSCGDVCPARPYHNVCEVNQGRPGSASHSLALSPRDRHASARLSFSYW